MSHKYITFSARRTLTITVSILCLFFLSSFQSERNIDKKITTLEYRMNNRKAEIADLTNRIDTLYKISAENSLSSLEVKALLARVNKLQNTIESNNKNLETLIAINSNASSFMGNQLDSLAYTFGWLGTFIALVIAILGFFISRAYVKGEKRINESIKESQEIYYKVDEMKQKVVALQEDIDNNLQDTYRKLRTSEIHELINKLKDDPKQIKNLYSRLITLNIPSTYYEFFVELIHRLDEKKEYYGYPEYAVAFLLINYPDKVDTDQRITPLFIKYWHRALGFLSFFERQELIFKYHDNVMESKDEGIEREYMILINALLKYDRSINWPVVYFDKFSSKEDRFYLYKYFESKQLTEFIFEYSRLLVQEYLNDPDLNKDQQAIIAHNKPME